MSYPTATRKNHERFCVVEGWEQRKTATGSKGTNHVRYELVLPDGKILYTRISHPVDRSDYGTQMWSHILRDQLQVSPAEFWSCVRDGCKPARGGPPQPPPEAIPLGVVQGLMAQGVPERDIKAMSKSEAIQQLTEYYSKP